jgi:hypothetical protein
MVDSKIIFLTKFDPENCKRQKNTNIVFTGPNLIGIT